MAKITDTLKLKIIELDNSGVSSRSISKKTGISKSSIGDFLRRETYISWWQSYEKKATPITKLITVDVSLRDSVSDFCGNHFGKDTGKEDNSRILLISDMHIPYHHKDTIDFLKGLKEKYKPTRVICLGDELDKHALSYHDSDPDLHSAGDELLVAREVIAELYKLFPKMDIIESNHGSLVWRKARTHGIPRAYIKSYADVLGVSNGWKWWFDLTIDLPNGQKCYFHHGKTNNVVRLSQQMGMCVVQGHYHNDFKIDYWANPIGLYWGLQIGCLIDDESYAFAYNNTNIKRPIIGTGLIINGKPLLEPMGL